MPALTLPTKLAAFAYIITFVLGTVTAMGGYAAVIGARGPAVKWPPAVVCHVSDCCWHAAVIGQGGAGAARATKRQRAAGGALTCFQTLKGCG